jgi:hypothetical protein
MGERKERLDGRRADQKVTRRKNAKRKAKARVRKVARVEARAAKSAK